MLPNDTRNALVADIAAHLVTHGSKRWGIVRAQYPHVSQSTFYRCLKEVKAATAAASGGPLPARAGNASQISQPDIYRGTAISARPAFLETGRARDVFEELRALAADAEALRRYATDGKGEILNPKAFLESAKIRERITLIGLRELQNIFDLEYQQKFYNTLMELVLTHVPPSSKLAVIEAMEKLNSREQNVCLMGDAGGATAAPAGPEPEAATSTASAS